MALTNFRTYQLSIQFHKLAKQVKCTNPIRDQLMRAATSIALNLSEGSAKPSPKERTRFYFIALGSLRECQTVFELLELERESEPVQIADKLGASIYKLARATEVYRSLQFQSPVQSPPFDRASCQSFSEDPDSFEVS